MCGWRNGLGLNKRGTWDIPDMAADGVWRLKIAGAGVKGVSLYAGM